MGPTRSLRVHIFSPSSLDEEEVWSSKRSLKVPWAHLATHKTTESVLRIVGFTHLIIVSKENRSTMSTLFERCAVANDGDHDLMLQCVSDGFEEHAAAAAATLDEWLLVLAGALVFFMQVSGKNDCGH